MGRGREGLSKSRRSRERSLRRTRRRRTSQAQLSSRAALDPTTRIETSTSRTLNQDRKLRTATRRTRIVRLRRSSRPTSTLRVIIIRLLQPQQHLQQRTRLSTRTTSSWSNLRLREPLLLFETRRASGRVSTIRLRDRWSTSRLQRIEGWIRISLG